MELPSEDRFSLVCEKLVFLKAFELATTTNITNEVGESQDQMEVDDESDTAAKSGRITKALVESLKAEAAEKVEQNDADLQSELSGAIDIKIQAAIEYIDNLLSTASQVVGGISEEVLSG